jgi:hypothetical protein
MRTGYFPSVQDVEGMADLNSKLTPTRAERLFRRGNVLAPEIVSQILDRVDEAFVEYFLCGKDLIRGFGTMDGGFTDAMDKYKITVLNKIATWETEYQRVHGELEAELQGRLAYALQYDIYGKVPRPVLTSSFVLALNTLFEKIPSVIAEVSNSLALVFISNACTNA